MPRTRSGPKGWRRNSSAVTTPKFGPAPRIAPTEVWLHLFTRPHQATVGSHQLHCFEIVERQAVPALEPPDAAAERQAGNARVADRPDRTDEAMRLGRLIELGE